jgi:hypothetical protein
MILGTLASMLWAIQNYAVSSTGTATTSCTPGDSTPCDTGLPVVGASSAQLQQIIQIGLGIAGAITVLVIIIAGLRFITAQGNPQEVAKARGTLLYAIIGLVIIMSAEAIVSFVLFQTGKV